MNQIQISAGQHIYGNIEKDESPRKVSGYQTIYYTTNFINNISCSELGERVVYRYSASENPPKHCCFNLEDKYVISRIVPVSHGQRDSYLSHSLLLTESDFSKVHYNPFILYELSSKLFVDALSEVVNPEGKDNTHIASINFPITESEIHCFCDKASAILPEWEEGTILHLLHLTIEYASMLEMKQSITLKGSYTSIYNALKLIFIIAPENVLKHCSFDSYFYKLSFNTFYYWAVGNASENRLGSIRMDVDKRVVDEATPTYQWYEDLYFNWIKEKKKDGNLTYIFQHKDALWEWISRSRGMKPLTLYENNLLSIKDDYLELLLNTLVFPTARNYLTGIVRNEDISLILAQVKELYMKTYSNNLSIPKTTPDDFILEAVISIYKNRQLPETTAKELLVSLSKTHPDRAYLIKLMFEKKYSAIRNILSNQDRHSYLDSITLLMKLDAPFEEIVPEQNRALFRSIFIELKNIDLSQYTDFITYIKSHIKSLYDRDIFYDILVYIVGPSYRYLYGLIADIYLDNSSGNRTILDLPTNLDKDGIAYILRNYFKSVRPFNEQLIELREFVNANKGTKYITELRRIADIWETIYGLFENEMNKLSSDEYGLRLELLMFQKLPVDIIMHPSKSKVFINIFLKNLPTDIQQFYMIPMVETLIRRQQWSQLSTLVDFTRTLPDYDKNTLKQKISPYIDKIPIDFRQALLIKIR